VLDVKPLRITSLALFGVTIGKVFLVDLAELEAYIRVFLLIAIGALLILGGYIYLRRREDMGAPT
jgi:LPXTG-motif cell wall-anchored protein